MLLLLKCYDIKMVKLPGCFFIGTSSCNNQHKKKKKLVNCFRSSLNDQLMRVINKDVSPEDVDLIFLIFDNAENACRSVNKNDVNNVMQRFAASNVKQ